MIALLRLGAGGELEAEVGWGEEEGGKREEVGVEGEDQSEGVADLVLRLRELLLRFPTVPMS